jgi:DNA-binding winged helix-turn-helix (wHTH) protein/tetratricopeptide (TPR) repeat protein
MSLQKVPSFFLDLSQPTMERKEGHSYSFGNFRINLSERRLAEGGRPIPLTPKAFDVLSILVRQAGHLVEKEELMSKVWPDSFVEEANVARIVHTIRKKLGDDGNGNSFIETVPTKGYRFVADVQEFNAASGDLSKEVSTDEVHEVAVTHGSDLFVVSEPANATGRHRQILLTAAIMVLFVVATGFWVSNGTLLPKPPTAESSRHSTNGEAYREFEQGKLLAEARTADSAQQALGHFERAIQIDPYYAEAYAGMADAKTYLFMNSNAHDDIVSARAAVSKALELDENDVYAHTIQCRILGTYDWEFKQAVTECQRAVALGPNDHNAHMELGLALGVVGRTDEASAEMDTAVALSPTSFNKRSRAELQYISRRYDDAIEQFEQVAATDPDQPDAVRWLMSCFAMKNDHENAFRYLLMLQEKNGINVDDLNAVKAAFAIAGWTGALHASLDASSGFGAKKSLLTAGLFAQIGEKDRAFEILNDMHKRRVIMTINVAREPLLDPIRDDPRYSAFLSQMKLN